MCSSGQLKTEAGQAECNNPCKSGDNLYQRVEPEKLIFIAEWFDREAELVKKYLIIFHTVDATIEIVDLVNNRRFLRRMKVDTVKMDDLYIGNVINIYARHMTLTEYADSCTRQYLEPKTERAFLMVKPDTLEYLGFIIQRIEKCFRVIRAKTACLGFEMACKFFSHFQGQEFYSSMMDYVSSGPVAVFLVVAENAIQKMKTLVGNEDPAQARLESPTSLRALYGKDAVHNAFHISETKECVVRDSGFFFTECRDMLSCVAPNTAVICDSTCCIVKPHAVKEGLAGRIITDICAARFKIVALEMFYLDRTHAEEFYEIYKGVLAEYAAMTEELALGPCYVLEVAGCISETPKALRSACGPMDPDLARKLRPQSLRARYGVDKVHNAVHCTDLVEDAQMELEYFFRILTMKS